ncbi:pentapeptide repeat-containing protein [Megasphaera elsdenii]
MNYEHPPVQDQTYFEAPEETKGQQFTNCTFQSADLSGKDFTGTTFTDCTFDHAYAKGADFTNASFDHCTLSHSSFKEASFKEASFTDSLGNGNDYRDADFMKAAFTKSRENEAHLNGADFTDAKAENTFYMPEGFTKGEGIKANYWDAELEDKAEAFDKNPDLTKHFEKAWHKPFEKDLTSAEKARAWDAMNRDPQIDAIKDRIQKAREEEQRLRDNPEKVIGVYRFVDREEDDDRLYMYPSGGYVISGYSKPDEPEIIQGHAIEFPDGSAYPYPEDLEMAEEGQGAYRTLRCDGVGKTLDEACDKADKHFDELRRSEEIESELRHLHPNFDEEVTPNEVRANDAIDLAKVAKDDLVKERWVTISDRQDEKQVRFIEDVKWQMGQGKSLEEAYQLEKDRRKLENSRGAEYEALCTPETKEVLFKEEYQAVKDTGNTYRNLIKETEKRNRETESEAFQKAKKREVAAMHVYLRACDTAIHKEEALRQETIRYAMETGKPMKEALIEKGAESMQQSQVETLKKRYIEENRKENAPIMRGSMDELDDTFNPKHFEKRLEDWRIVHPDTQKEILTKLAAQNDETLDKESLKGPMYVRADKGEYVSLEGLTLHYTTPTRSIEKDEQAKAMDAIYTPSSYENYKSGLFPREKNLERNRTAIREAGVEKTQEKAMEKPKRHYIAKRKQSQEKGRER